MASISKNHLVPVLVQDTDAVILLVQLHSLRSGVLQRLELTLLQIALPVAPFYGVHNLTSSYVFVVSHDAPRGVSARYHQGHHQAGRKRSGQRIGYCSSPG